MSLHFRAVVGSASPQAAIGFSFMALKIGASCLYESASGGGRKEMKVVALRIDGYCQLSHSFLKVFGAGRVAAICLLTVVAFLYVSVHPIDALSRGTFW